jgi:hypothetical protein
MSRELWVKHYTRRCEEAEQNWPNKSEETRETWASLMADQDSADEQASQADRLWDEHKEGL